MTTRPDSLPKSVWAKLDETGKIHAAKIWPTLPTSSDDDVCKNDIIEAKAVDTAIELIMSVEAVDKTADKALESPAIVDAMPSDVKAWIAQQQAKVTAELKAFVHDTVQMQIENDERKILLFLKIEAAGLDVPATDSKPNPSANTYAQQLGDVYYVEGKTADSDKIKRHRVHDLADDLFGNGYVAKVNKLEGMGDDAKTEYGIDKYQEDLALAKKELSILRRKFSEACDAVVAYRASNNLPGIDVVVSNSKSPKPFLLRERLLDADGNVLKDKDGLPKFGRTSPIAVATLERFDAEKAKTLLSSGDLKRAGSETEKGTMFDAILKSQPPKKPRTGGKGGKASDSTAATGKDVRINNINQWESGSADMAAMVEDTGTLGAWLKRCNDPDKVTADAFILSEYKIMLFHERGFSMADGAILKRAKALYEAEAVAQAADKAKTQAQVPAVAA